MATENRESMVKPEFMSEEDWEMIKGQTASLDRIKGDAEADVEDYLANPDGRATGAGPSGLPTLLLTCIGWAPRKPRRQLRRSNRSPTRASSSDSAATSGGRVPPLGTSL